MFLIGANQFKKLPSDLMYKFKIFVIEVLNQSWEEFLHDIYGNIFGWFEVFIVILVLKYLLY